MLRDSPRVPKSTTHPSGSQRALNAVEFGVSTTTDKATPQRRSWSAGKPSCETRRNNVFTDSSGIPTNAATCLRFAPNRWSANASTRISNCGGKIRKALSILSCDFSGENLT